MSAGGPCRGSRPTSVAVRARPSASPTPQPPPLVALLIRLMRLPMAAVLLLLSLAAQAGVLTVEMLDVGQGDSILITSPGGKRVLIDAGIRGADVVGRLKARGVEGLDLVIATHPHADHIGGMADVLHGLPVRFYTDNGLPHTTRTYQAVMDAVEEEEITYRPAERGQSYRLDDGARVEVLFPDGVPLRNTRSDLNSNSVVVRLTHGDDCFLFMGDAEDPTEQALLHDGVKPCGVLKVAHHGSSHSTSAAWLRAIEPTIALVSVGAENRYGHPDGDTLARLESAGATVFRTDLDGALLLESDGHRVVVTTDSAPEGQPAVVRAEMRRKLVAAGRRPGPRRRVAADAAEEAPVAAGDATAATAAEATAAEATAAEATAVATTDAAPDAAPDATTNTDDCAFIASRNSRLYHPAGCHVIDRIYSANRVCYPTAEAAEAAGKTRSHACPTATRKNPSSPAPSVGDQTRHAGG